MLVQGAVVGVAVRDEQPDTVQALLVVCGQVEMEVKGTAAFYV